MAFNPHEYLNSFTNFESQLHKLRPDDFHLNRIERFLDLAGNPVRDLKIIHVAGTKGKGSTCAFLAAILQQAGYKVGLYTSPHLHRVNERIRLLTPENRQSKDPFSGSITDEELADVLAFLRPFAASIQNAGHILTYFEVLTVAALYWFSKMKADVVILETGLGGRLDATNAVDSLIALITPISLDHTQILGSTLDKIAWEKAGIIKNSHQKVVIAPQEKGAMDILLSRCREFGVTPVLVSPQKYAHAKIGLKGGHQIINAAMAGETALLLRMGGFKISDEIVSDGLKNVRWPGRFELLGKNPDIILDGAHNEASAKALAQTLKEEYPKQRVVLVLGISQDKNVTAICNHLKDSAGHIVLTKASHPRAHRFTKEEGQHYFGVKPFELTENLKSALEAALKVVSPQDVIVVTGSLFIVGEARDILSITV